MSRAAYYGGDGLFHAWPRETPRSPSRPTLFGVPVTRCFGCGVSFVSTTRLCPWCGAVRHSLSVPACPRGHPLCGAGVYVRRDGRRSCAECRRARERAKPRRRHRRLRVAA